MAAESDETKIAVMATDLGYIKKSVENIDSTLKDFSKQFVTKSEFEPYKRVIQSVGMMVLTGIVAAILKLILIK